MSTGERNVTLDRAYRWSVRFVMIKSLADKRTAAIFSGYAVKVLSARIQRPARAKLLAVDAAANLEDLRIPPENRLETLRGDRRGQYSICVNDRWRIRFAWRDEDAWNVEITDYH